MTALAPALPQVATDHVTDPRVAGVGGSGLLIITGLLCALSAITTTSPPALPLTASALAALILSLRIRRRPERWAPAVSALAGAALLVVATWTATAWATSIAVLFVGVGIYAAFFLRAVPLVAVLVVGLAGQALALAHGGQETAVLTAVATTVTVVSTTVLVRWLRGTISCLMASLEEAARTDALTGLLSRRGLFERIEFELQRSARTGKPLSILVGDLDRFKALNDGLGHMAGDAALVRVAAVLEDASRRTDAVGRLGGDEFVVVLPETDAGGAQIHADRARDAIADAFAVDPIRIAITFGAATVTRPDLSVEAILDEADRHLYAAKAGRPGTPRLTLVAT